jgi:voltage-gated potassium channel
LARRASRRVYDLLESRNLRGWRLVVQGGLILLILANVVAVVLETVEPLAQAHADAFETFEIVSVAIFAVEYVARLYACIENPRDKFRHPLWGRLRFALTPLALVDLLAILPLFLQLVFGADVSSLRMLRILRVFKLMHYSPSMAMLGRVLYNERKGLGGAFVIFTVLLLLSAALAYFVERDAQPKTFGSIPDAMWWAMAALTTVGYGDVTPATPLAGTLAFLEAIVGQFYIGITVARLVSLSIERGSPSGQSKPDP